jgi:glucosamine kinase
MMVLAIDVGRTALRAAVFTDGARGPSVQLDSGATLSDPDGARRVVRAVETALRALGNDAAPALDTMVVAAAGAITRPDHVEAAADALVVHVRQDVVVTTDVVAAHAGALAGRPGVVIAAGTGAVAFAIDGQGGAKLVDGAGYLVGDAGSGFTVGRAGLAAALRHHDGRPGGSHRLASAAEEQFGPLDDLAGKLHGSTSPARNVASFAPAVAQAARDDDPVAVAIWRDAVRDLADTAIAACRTLPEQDRRVAVTGSLFDLTDLVAEPFSATVTAGAPGISVRAAPSDATTGAASLADAPAGIYENLLLRRSSSHQARYRGSAAHSRNS